MTRAIRWLWKTGGLSTFVAGLFAVLPIVITIGIMAWVGGVLEAWLGPESFVGKALSQMGLRLVTDPTVASILGWFAVVLAIWLLGALLKWVGKKRFEMASSAAMAPIPLVNMLYKPVAQVVDLMQRRPADTVEGMSVVYCAFGHEGSGGFLGLLVSDQVYRLNGQTSRLVYVPTSPLPMSGVTVFAASSVDQTWLPGCWIWQQGRYAPGRRCRLGLLPGVVWFVDRWLGRKAHRFGCSEHGHNPRE